MRTERLEVLLSWIVIAGLVAFVAYSFAILDLWWAFVGIGAFFIVISSLMAKRRVVRVMPAELIILLIAPLYIHATSVSWVPPDLGRLQASLLSFSSVMTYSVIGLFIIAELQAFTKLRMNRSFAVLFVMIFSLGSSAIWTIFEYVSDAIVGTQLLTSNEDVMWRFILAMVGGIMMGLLLDAYLKLMPERRLRRFGLERLGGPVEAR